MPPRLNLGARHAIDLQRCASGFPRWSPDSQQAPRDVLQSTPSRWRRAFMALVFAPLACGVIACSSFAAASADQLAARATAQQYLDAVSQQDWAQVYELSDSASQAAQPLEAQREVFLAHPDMFTFEAAHFEGHTYFASMTGADRMTLTGSLTGGNPARRTFRIELEQQLDATWRVRSFNVNMELVAPTTPPSP